jgi:hypothetical protein
MPSLEDNTTQVGAHTDNRHIIPMKSQGFLQTPQEIIEKYNGCSVPQYTAYRRVGFSCKGVKGCNKLDLDSQASTSIVSVIIVPTLVMDFPRYAQSSPFPQGSRLFD